MKRKRYIFIFELLITLNTLLGNSIYTCYIQYESLNILKRMNFVFIQKISNNLFILFIQRINLNN